MEKQKRGRRLLILGNGFDLAHGLPTRYTDFLDFCNIIMSLDLGNEKIYLQHKIKSLQGEIDRLKWNDFVKKSIKDTLQENVKIVSDLWKLLNNNIWYVFFDTIRRFNGMGPNWIDFEKEIRNVIEFADRQDIDLDERAEDLLHCYNDQSEHKEYMYDVKELYNSQNKRHLFGEYTEQFLKQSNQNKFNDILKELTLRDLRKYWYQHLENFIEALNIYFAYFIDCVPSEDIKTSEKVAPIITGIEKIDPDYVINFNYTHTYEKLYAKPKPFYIHGECTKEIGKNNIVLGIDQYWKTEEERQEHVNYAIFKKYVQRIRKRTGNKHHEMLMKLERPISLPNYKGAYFDQEIYVFGHSLDKTDKDILASFFNVEVAKKVDAKITVFYHDKETEGELIANMVSLIGEEKVLDKSERSKLSFMELSELR